MWIQCILHCLEFPPATITSGARYHWVTTYSVNTALSSTPDTKETTKGKDKVWVSRVVVLQSVVVLLGGQNLVPISDHKF